MPTLRDLLEFGVPIGAQVAGGLINRRASGNATRRVGAGTTAAMDRISAGADTSRRTMADIYGRQQETLQPWRASGERSLQDLDAGVREGGGLADPFQWVPPDLANDPIFQRRLQEGQRLIEAKGNAGGKRFSAATMKDFGRYAEDLTHDYLSDDYARAEGTFRQNQYDRLNALSGMANRGFDAARTEVDAGGAYGANLARLDQTTAAQLADLEQQKAEAEALGDVAGANAITDTISGILSTVSNTRTARSMADVLRGGAGAVGAGTSLGAIAGGSVPAIPLGATGAATAGTGGLATLGATTPGYVGPSSAAGLSGGGGIGGALAAAAPFAIAGGAALAGGLLWRKSQAHHEANDWVQNFQNPFDAQIRQIDALRLPPEQAAAQKDAVMTDYIAAAMEFAKKGSDQAEVIQNAMRTFRKYYGDPLQYGGVA